ncbi:hypothetical protein [Oxalicibacterium solurbis]|uniref:hypothetical protein n=1 Tax=Oxalicibacterium solurbis TaxID=69280 RepID=UPI00166C22DE|nr:hypothetical protein [Oxalicibacterium solurbis]
MSVYQQMLLRKPPPLQTSEQIVTRIAVLQKKSAFRCHSQARSGNQYENMASTPPTFAALPAHQAHRRFPADADAA